MTANEDGSQSPRTVTSNIITGTVKWFNVRSGYGFIKRNDTDEDIFVHQTAIIKNNPKKYLRSVGDGEIVEFIVIQGAKGPEAAQVTGPNGTHVEGSKYAPERRPRFPRRRNAPRKNVQTGGQDSQGEERDNSDEGEDTPNKREQQPIRRRPRRPNRGYYRGGYRSSRRGPPRDREDTREQEREPLENSPREPRNNDYAPRRGGPRRRRGGPRRVEGEYNGQGGGDEGQREGGYNESRTYRPRGTGGRRGRRPRGPPRNPPNENNQNGEDEEPQQQQQQGDSSPKQ